MSPPIGFLVWCPEHGLPTVVHGSFLQAVAEADRLKRQNPGKRFVVMSPVEDMSGVGYALGWSRGREEGLAEAHREILAAEAETDRLKDEVHLLRFAKPVIGRAKAFQAIVADCLLWFDGFRAASAQRDEWERPHTPDRDTLRQLNGALQDLADPEIVHLLEEEVPF